MFQFLLRFLGFCDIDCPVNLNPVCGSNQVTYDNQCFLMKSIHCGNKDDHGYAYAGPCVPTTQLPESTLTTTEEACFLVCHKLYEPVCGSNNVTYSNACMFDEAIHCGRAPHDTFIEYNGLCK